MLDDRGSIDDEVIICAMHTPARQPQNKLLTAQAEVGMQSPRIQALESACLALVSMLVSPDPGECVIDD